MPLPLSSPPFSRALESLLHNSVEAFCSPGRAVPFPFMLAGAIVFFFHRSGAPRCAAPSLTRLSPFCNPRNPSAPFQFDVSQPLGLITPRSTCTDAFPSSFFGISPFLQGANRLPFSSSRTPLFIFLAWADFLHRRDWAAPLLS